LAISRIASGILRHDPWFRAAARSPALKKSRPKLETGNAVDLPLPGGPAIINILGDISRQSRGRRFPAYLWAGRCESVCRRDGQSQTFQLVGRLLKTRAGSLEVRIGLGFLQLRTFDCGHAYFYTARTDRWADARCGGAGSRSEPSTSVTPRVCGEASRLGYRVCAPAVHRNNPEHPPRGLAGSSAAGRPW